MAETPAMALFVLEDKSTLASLKRPRPKVAAGGVFYISRQAVQLLWQVIVP